MRSAACAGTSSPRVVSAAYRESVRCQPLSVPSMLENVAVNFGNVSAIVLAVPGGNVSVKPTGEVGLFALAVGTTKPEPEPSVVPSGFLGGSPGNNFCQSSSTPSMS